MKERDKEIVRLRKSGQKFNKIAKQFSLSPSRVRVICDDNERAEYRKNNPPMEMKEIGFRRHGLGKPELKALESLVKEYVRHFVVSKKLAPDYVAEDGRTWYMILDDVGRNVSWHGDINMATKFSATEADIVTAILPLDVIGSSYILFPMEVHRKENDEGKRN